MDLVVVLVIVLVIVLIWRGPKTLPLLGKAFGQGVREARQEIDGMKSGSEASASEPAAPAPGPADGQEPPKTV